MCGSGSGMVSIDIFLDVFCTRMLFVLTDFIVLYFCGFIILGLMRFVLYLIELLPIDYWRNCMILDFCCALLCLKNMFPTRS